MACMAPSVKPPAPQKKSPPEIFIFNFMTAFSPGEFGLTENSQAELTVL